MSLEVYKFGGASIENARRIISVSKIISNCTSDQLVVIVSAMGKTTNALEEVWRNWHNPEKSDKRLAKIRKSHIEVAKELCPDNPSLIDKINELTSFNGIEESDNKDKLYDRIVSIGELLSTRIVCEYLKEKGLKAKWLDAREVVKTNDTFRDGKINWENTEETITEECNKLLKNANVIISQGFIGSSANGDTTTLGREGSDFSAAIFAYILNADRVVIWKDVQGILTGDPRRFENVLKIDRMSYRESIEMAYYGAKVIHPKTIKPLQNKQIPLYAKSFLQPSAPGTLISSEIELTYPSIVVIEENQVLLHFATKDFSFIAEEHLAQLFQELNKNRIKVNIMKNTAISFSICVTNVPSRIERLVEALSEEYRISVDQNLELISIRHYTEDIIKELRKGKVVLMEEKAPNTVQLIVREVPLMKRKP